MLVGDWFMTTSSSVGRKSLYTPNFQVILKHASSAQSNSTSATCPTAVIEAIPWEPFLPARVCHLRSSRRARSQPDTSIGELPHLKAEVWAMQDKNQIADSKQRHTYWMDIEYNILGSRFMVGSIGPKPCSHLVRKMAGIRGRQINPSKQAGFFLFTSHERGFFLTCLRRITLCRIKYLPECSDLRWHARR